MATIKLQQLPTPARARKAKTEVTSGREMVIGGAFEGADKLERETASWFAPRTPTDVMVSRAKTEADARGRDMAVNDGMTQGAVQTYMDATVGSAFRLNAKPDWKTLGADKVYAEELQEYLERKFNLIAESPDNWLDAKGELSFAEQIRLTVCTWAMTGESLSAAEWLKDDPSRPCKTATVEISPDRLCNPNGVSDDSTLRRGVVKTAKGRVKGYHIRVALPGDNGFLGGEQWDWRYIPARKPWGRRQIIHIKEMRFPDQTRGLSAMVAVLKRMRMTKKFQDLTLQNAAVNATYAAALESDLPPALVQQMMGASAGGTFDIMGAYHQYMSMVASYYGNSPNVKIDGALMPTLFPGTKMNLQPMGTPGGVGTEFEGSLIRHIAAGLGMSAEELGRDYTKTNYSGAKAAIANTGRAMGARKKFIADRKASETYRLWFEEDWNAGNMPRMRGWGKSKFYEPLMKDAFTKAAWISSGNGQIDEMKETQAALLRIKGGLSTWEKECARMGDDWREVFEQRQREDADIKRLGLLFSTDAQKDQGGTQGNLADDPQAGA